MWRQLKAAGAVYLVDSVAALPSTPAAECLLRRLQHGISEAGGSAQLLSAGALAGQAALVAAFNRARDDEYPEIIAQCQDILAGVTAGMRDGEVHGVAQAGVALARLARSCERVRSRDVLVPARRGRPPQLSPSAASP